MLTYLFVTALLTMVATKFWLGRRQIRHIMRHRETVPTQFASAISAADHRRAADYTVACTRLSLWETLAHAALLVALILLGGLQFLYATLSHWLGQGYGGQIALVAAVLALSTLVALPFTYFR